MPSSDTLKARVHAKDEHRPQDNWPFDKYGLPAPDIHKFAPRFADGDTWGSIPMDGQGDAMCSEVVSHSTGVCHKLSRVLDRTPK